MAIVPPNIHDVRTAEHASSLIEQLNLNSSQEILYIGNSYAKIHQILVDKIGKDAPKSKNLDRRKTIISFKGIGTKGDRANRPFLFATDRQSWANCSCVYDIFYNFKYFQSHICFRLQDSK